MDTARTDGTWLLTRDAAKAGGVTDKALRRRIERGTVVSELREDGRRYVLVDSITDEPPRPAGAPSLPRSSSAWSSSPPRPRRCAR